MGKRPASGRSGRKIDYKGKIKSFEIYKSIRKPIPSPARIEKDKKNYNRKKLPPVLEENDK